MGKNVLCILSGSNNEIGRMAEIRMRSNIHASVERYYIANFFEVKDSMKNLLNELNEDDDVIQMAFTKHTERPSEGPCLIGLRFSCPENIVLLEALFLKLKISYQVVEPGSPVYKLLM